VAEQHLEAFAPGEWGQKYPTIVTAWRRAREQGIPFFAHPLELRRVIYPTNAIECPHMQERKIIKNHGHFSSEEASAKLIHLASRHITARRKMPPVFWKPAMNRFAIRSVPGSSGAHSQAETTVRVSEHWSLALDFQLRLRKAAEWKGTEHFWDF